MFIPLWFQPIEYHAELVKTVYAEEIVEAPVIESLEEMAARLAEPYGLKEKVFSIVENESRWNPNAVGRDGEIGLVQILPSAHPQLTIEEMYDPETALKYLIYEIINGREWQWTSCSCVSYLRARGNKLPKGDAKDLVTNSGIAVGNVVKLRYGNTYHLAEVIGFDHKHLRIKESNFLPCMVGQREISIDSKEIVGFWKYEI